MEAKKIAKQQEIGANRSRLKEFEGKKKILKGNMTGTLLKKKGKW